jgi:hypothetical protein
MMEVLNAFIVVAVTLVVVFLKKAYDFATFRIDQVSQVRVRRVPLLKRTGFKHFDSTNLQGCQCI